MRKPFLALFVASAILLSAAFPVLAAEGTVTYSGNAGAFIFEPGSEHSPTDLFPELKDVMPGDTLTQRITVKNSADEQVKVKIYMRALGAHQESAAFLSRLGLQVAKSPENEMAYMFDAAANETAQLTDWVCLGTLYAGGEVALDVTLSVPVELPNEFQNSIGYLDWEFRIEEFPAEPGDPQPPHTGIEFNVAFWFVLMLCALTMLVILLIWRKREKEE